MNNKMTNEEIAQLCENRTKVSIYLLNGVKLIDVIKKFDDESILMEKQGMVVFRRSIATIAPNNHYSNNSCHEDGNYNYNNHRKSY